MQNLIYIIIILAGLILALLLAVLYGLAEAKYWYYVYNGKAKRIKKNEHELWTVIRAITYLPIVYIWWQITGWYAIFGGIALMFYFPYFHDGMYYYSRNKYDGSYPRKWKDFSRTSTAKLTADYRARLAMLYVGTICLAAMIFGSPLFPNL